MKRERRAHVYGGGVLVLVISAIALLFAGIFYVTTSATTRGQSPVADGTVFAYTYQSATLQPASTGWSICYEDGGQNFEQGTNIIKLTITNNSSKIAGRDPIKGSPVDVSVEGEILYAYVFEIDGQPDADGQEMVIYGDVATIYAPQDCSYLFAAYDVNDTYTVFAPYGGDGEITSITFDCFNGENVEYTCSLFNGQYGLDQLDLSGFNVTHINNNTFADTSLSSIILPNSVTSIEGAFVNCENLQYTIDHGTDGDVYYLGSIDSSYSFLIKAENTISDSYSIHSGCKVVANKAFGYCTSLSSITIPSGVTSICSGAFLDCTSLSNITIPSGVTSIRASVFNGCTSLTDMNHTPANENDHLINLPSSVTSIETNAFWGCTSLSNITIPSSVTSIGDSAFQSCTSLTDMNHTPANENDHLITIPSGVTSIGESAFYGCTSLSEITIPSSVTSIGASAFLNCNILNEVILLCKCNDVSIGTYVFFYQSVVRPRPKTTLRNLDEVSIYVLDDQVDDYQGLSGWDVYESVIKSINEKPGYVVPDVDTGVVADIILPSIIITTLCIAIAYVLLGEKKKSI